MMWEEVILESPPTVAVWEQEEDGMDDETWVHIYRNGLRMFEFLTPGEAREIIREIQELADERLTDFGEADGF